ncbi:MAG: hypothetical protein R3C68_06920 [Myxococcota bacterium]
MFTVFGHGCGTYEVSTLHRTVILRAYQGMPFVGTDSGCRAPPRIPGASQGRDIETNVRSYTTGMRAAPAQMQANRFMGLTGKNPARHRLRSSSIDLKGQHVTVVDPNRCAVQGTQRAALSRIKRVNGCGSS